MASATGTTGSGAYIAFGGTVLSTNFRTIDSDNTMNVVDQTAADDTGMTVLNTIEDGAWSLEVKRPAGGTTNWITIQVGDSGTLEIGPEGTATSNPKMTAVVTLTRYRTNIPYADIVMDTYDFVLNDNTGVTYTSY